MKLVRHDPRSFLAAAGPFLERAEAEHILMLGTAKSLMDGDITVSAPPLVAAHVRRDNRGMRMLAGTALLFALSISWACSLDVEDGTTPLEASCRAYYEAADGCFGGYIERCLNSCSTIDSGARDGASIGGEGWARPLPND